MGSLIKLALGSLGGVWGYLAAAGVAAVIATGATYSVVHNANAVAYEQLQLQKSGEEKASISASLAQLQGFIAQMHVAATDFVAIQNDIDTRFDALKKGLPHAFAVPLPANCKPDVERVRSLHAAVAATNAGTSP